VSAGLPGLDPGRLVISGWSVVSPYGIGAESFADGFRSAAGRVVALDRADWPVPQERGAQVPEFDARTVLGRKGTRSMDRSTALAVVTAGDLLKSAGLDKLGQGGADTGLVLGTSNGSVQSMMDFTCDSHLGERPYLVDPARFPNTVMNCAAGQSAIWHGLRGPNATIAAGSSTMLAVLAYALRLVRAGHAEVMLCGAVEELSPQRCRLDAHRGTAERPLGEGCVLFLVEPADRAESAGRSWYAEPVAVETGVHGPQADPVDVLARCVQRVLDRAQVAPDRFWAAATGTHPAWEHAAFERVLADRVPRLIETEPLIGDTGAAAGGFALASLLVAAEQDPDAVGRHALVSTADHDGVVGCALLRMGPSHTRNRED
jgi:3-oxoacyl-[acyl-carrier-protein] synthase II